MHIKTCLGREYDDADNELPWVGAEGGYLGRHWTTEELLVEEVGLELPRDQDETLLDELVSRLPEITWCEANGIGPNDTEIAESSWDRFREVVVHNRRFFFMASKRDHLDFHALSPGETLRNILGFARQIDLVKDFPQGAFIYRARLEEAGSCFKTASELGPPPLEAAFQSNRMSPAGIVMYYGAEDAETSLKETVSESGQVAVGVFQTLMPARILDLTSIPELPSLFEPGQGVASKRRMLKFLRHVAEQISRPIEHDGREHIEYVPTQVVTEFIRTQMTSEDSRIDGIRYNSSANPGHSSIVLFATQANVVDGSSPAIGEEKWLKLVHVSHHFFDPHRHYGNFKFPALIGRVTKSLSRCNQRLCRLLRRRWYLLVLR